MIADNQSIKVVSSRPQLQVTGAPALKGGGRPVKYDCQRLVQVDFGTRLGMEILWHSTKKMQPLVCYPTFNSQTDPTQKALAGYLGPEKPYLEIIVMQLHSKACRTVPFESAHTSSPIIGSPACWQPEVLP